MIKANIKHTTHNCHRRNFQINNEYILKLCVCMYACIFFPYTFSNKFSDERKYDDKTNKKTKTEKKIESKVKLRSRMPNINKKHRIKNTIFVENRECYNEVTNNIQTQ